MDKALVCLFALGCWCSPGTAVAAEWFVAPGGTGSGTTGSPFGRVQDGLNAAQPGDTITVAAGTYNGALTTVRAGTAGSRIRLRAAGSRGSVILANPGRVFTVNHAYVTLEGFVLDGQYGADDLLRVATAGHYLHLRNLEIRRSSRDLVDMGAPNGVLIENCLIHHGLNPVNGRSDAHGVVAGAIQDLTIRNTEIHTFSGDGIQIDPGRASPGWDRVLIEGARIWLQPLPAPENGFPAGIAPGENAIDTKAGASFPRASITIRDTVAFGFRDSEFMSNAAAFNLKENVDARVDRVTVSDCQIAFRTRGANSASPAGARVTVSNAVVFNVNTAFRYEDNIEHLAIWNSTVGAAVATPFQAASSTSAGLDVRNLLLLGTLPAVVSGSPGSLGVASVAFVNAAGGDYRLASDAYALDRGIPVSEVTTDRDGVARPQGAGYDVGAFERPVTTSPTAPTPPPPTPTSPPPTSPPSPTPVTPPREIAVHLGTTAAVAGAWRPVADRTAAGGLRLTHPDEGGDAIASPLAVPSDYVELSAWVESGVPYRLWIRGRADKNRAANDSVYVQFSGALDASGEPAFIIGTPSAATVSVEDCERCGLSAWGWQDNGWGKNVLGPVLFFASSGPQTIRIQTREDGISLDQLVLSPETYLNSAPGALKRDTTILLEAY